MIIQRRKERRQPELNMSSLPDLIFTVLFFFMIVTTMRSVPVKVAYRTPEGTMITKMKKKESTIYLFIGKSMNKGKKTGGDSFFVQVNDRLMPPNQVGAYVQSFKDNLLPDEQEEMMVAMKIDKDAPMGLVNEVKMQLRKVGALKVHYAATKKQFIPSER